MCRYHPCISVVFSSVHDCHRCSYRLVGLVVRRPPRERKIRGSNPTCDGIFRIKSFRWLKNWHSSGYPARRLAFWVSTGTGRPGVNILWLGELESLICNFYLWQHVRLSEQIRPWDTLACCWDVKQATNKQHLCISVVFSSVHDCHRCSYRPVGLVVRRPPRERQTWVRFPLFQVWVIPVT